MELKILLGELLDTKKINDRIVAIYRYDDEEGHRIVIDNLTTIQVVESSGDYMLVASNSGTELTTVRDLCNKILRCKNLNINSVRAKGKLIHFKWINIVDYEDGTVGLILH